MKTVSTILASLISVIAFLGCEKSETSGLPDKAIQSATPGQAGIFDQEESDAKELLSQHGAGVVDSTPTGAARIIVFSIRTFSDLTPVGPALEKLKSLESIHLDYTQVHDLTPLTGLKNLKILRVNSTQVVDLKPVAELTNLESLNLDNTAVNDVAPLMKMTNLKKLSMSRTKVSKEQFESLQAALPDCHIAWSQSSS